MNSKLNSTEKVFSETVRNLTELDNPKLVVAFSGGVDSLALLAMAVKAFTNKNIIACYVNHRIRCNSELDKELELNENNCKKLGVELVVKDLGEGSVQALANERKGGTEEAARILRYQVLEEVLNEYKCDYILTAHHKDDQIETVLMRILRNSPEVSLRGISDKKGKLIRPLLSFYKEELVAYVEEMGLSWSTDSTNSDNSIYRNKIRNEILPKLRAENPNFDNEILSKRESALDGCADFEFEPSQKIDWTWFKALGKLKQSLVLYSCWDKYVGGLLPQTLIKRVVSAQKDSVISANGGSFCLYNGYLYLVSDKENKDFENFLCPVKETILPGNMKLSICSSGEKEDIFVEKGSLNSDYSIRFAKEGDSIALKDGKKMVLKLLQDNKVPSILRNRVPVMVCNDEVVAVFASVFGGRNRICSRLRTLLAPGKQYMYIIIKGI